LEGNQQKIELLLKQADAYFARQWYTTPEETNAFDVYREVLKLDPTNERAHQQIDEIAEFYKSRAEREGKRGRTEQAIQYYRKYLKIVPDDELILDRVMELEEQSSVIIFIWDSVKWGSGRWQ
jgi:tetratricopeptide (TPR) repeat protein